MARQVVVRIVSERAAEPSPEGASEEKKPSVKKEKKKKEEPSVPSLLMAFMGKKVVTAIKDESLYFVGKYFTATENYKAQTLVSNASATIDSLMSIGFSLYAGATAIGGFAGVMAGMSVAAFNVGSQAFKKYENEAEKIVENAYGNYFYGVRAGLVDGGHGTEN